MLNKKPFNTVLLISFMYSFLITMKSVGLYNSSWLWIIAPFIFLVSLIAVLMFMLVFFKVLLVIINVLYGGEL